MSSPPVRNRQSSPRPSSSLLRPTLSMALPSDDAVSEFTEPSPPQNLLSPPSLPTSLSLAMPSHGDVVVKSTVSSPPQHHSLPLSLPTEPPMQQLTIEESSEGPSRRHTSRSKHSQKTETITPPFPWSTDRRATVHTLNYLLERNIQIISGEVQCKRCGRQDTIEFDLIVRFKEIAHYVVQNIGIMAQRAPEIWKNPILPKCRYCGQENSVKPIIADKKRAINWLFLFLGQMLGCCTLEQLKYFCKHTANHRTGAKDRVLYLTYLCLCKQLEPSGPFNIGLQSASNLVI